MATHLGQAASVASIAWSTGVGQKELLREFEIISQEDTGRHSLRTKSRMEKMKAFFSA
ncbi:MAG: hypothetical protein LBE32_01215 [Burkholderiales bacterium]|jgi:hypothetical protein|nr:hypothetical protein [Burkholderiales bacterium]